MNDDDYYEIESSQSLKSKSKRQKMKKQRRSRITINDAVETEIGRKEVYDIDTKIKKSIQSASLFNTSLNKNRNGIAKHFLKRKVKAAFEREPLEKSKHFFNVLFIPNTNMFNPPQIQNIKPTPQQTLMAKPNVATTNPVNIPSTKISEFRQEIIKKPSIPEPTASNIIQINQPVEVIKKPEQSSSIIQINLDPKPKIEEPPKVAKPENAQQKQIIKQLVERYFSNPEKLRSEMPPNDFLKLQNFIKKNLGHLSNVPNISSNTSLTIQQPSTGDVNIQMLKNNLTGPSVSVSLNSQPNQNFKN
jgi:hypothetical protein